MEAGNGGAGGMGRQGEAVEVGVFVSVAEWTGRLSVGVERDGKTVDFRDGREGGVRRPEGSADGIGGGGGVEGRLRLQSAVV